MSTPAPRRGEVWLVELDKRRPVVILSRDIAAARMQEVIAAPISTRARGVATEVPLGGPEGLSRPSVARLDNTQLVSRSALVKRIGRVGPDPMQRICDALHLAVGCS